ncbi:MAG TPA: cold shock domain-containing protein [bacterium]|nr:cold shock domain-containing protein [bacterium]
MQQPVPTQRVKGTVTWYNRVSGFGFIHVQGQPDVFVAEAAIIGRGPLREGQAVELEVVLLEGRREAAHVVPIR